MMKRRDRNLRIALRLLDLGLAPIPCWTPAECAEKKCSSFRRPLGLKDGAEWTAPEVCDRPGKHPRVAWKRYQQEQPKADVVRRWFRRWPNANVAIITGEKYNLVAVDADSIEAYNWATEHLRSDIGSMTGIRDAATGWRGRQLYMGHPGGSIRNKVKLQTPDGKLALDIRADGGYVMAPGSMHPSGVEYAAVGKWSRAGLASLPKIDTKLIPDARGKGPASPMDRARAWATAKGPAIQGSGGDAHTYELANDLVRGFCLGDGEAYSILRDWNQSCRPPWADGALLQKIQNARRYGTGEYGYIVFRDRERYKPAPPMRATRPLVDGPAPLVISVGADGLAKNGTNGSNGHHEPCEPEKAWPEIVPLGVHRGPDFPVDCLPEGLRDFVAQEAIASQTPAALAGMAVLCAAAAAVAKKCKIEVRPGWQEPLNLYAAVVLPPAARKSQVLRDCVQPLEEFESDQARARGPDIKAAQVKASVLERAAEAAEKKAAKLTGENRMAAIEEAVFLSQQAADFQIPATPRVLADDVTAERLANLLSQQNGRIAIFSPEGGIFDLMAGRYSATATPNFEVYLKGHAGDTLRVDRMNRPAEFIQDPAITMCLAIQPDVIQGLGGRPGFRGRGLLGRFLFAYPESLLGSRQIDAPPLTSRARNSYANIVRRLLNLPLGDSKSPWAAGPPFAIVLAPEARTMLRDFEQWIEPQLSPYGEMGHMSDWGGKLAGAIARIAGVLHMAERSEDRKPWAAPVSAATMGNALGVAEFLIPHARIAYQEMEADERVGGAKYLLRWVERSGLTEFTQREAHRATAAKLKTSEQVENAITTLQAHGFIRLAADKNDKRGRGRPSVSFEVNPATNSVISVNCHGRKEVKIEGASIASINYTSFENPPLVTFDTNDKNPGRTPGEEG